MTNNTITIRITFDPVKPLDFNDSAYIEADTAAFKTIGRRFLQKMDNPRDVTGEPIASVEDFEQKNNRWMRFDIDESRRDVLRDLLECVESIDHTKLEPNVSVYSSNQLASILYARWVPFHCTYEVEEGTVMHDDWIDNYSVACASCGWLDLSHPKEPYRFRPPTEEKANIDKVDVLEARNGLVVCSPKAFEVFDYYVGDQIQSGTAKLIDGTTQVDWRWIRPSLYTGRMRGWEISEKCDVCGHPIRITRPKSKLYNWIVDSFNSLEGDIALVGDYSPGNWRPDEVNRLYPGLHYVSISGGFFTVLYNSGIKGLVWPDEGTLISMDLSEPTWEPERRFADVFTGKADKIKRKRVKPFP